MVEELKSHLLRRPFADIFNNLRNPDEKDNPIGLMLMCILDYQADKLKFYTRIAETQHPKLLLDLMGFRTYKSFFYYEYQNHGQLENKYLKCKFCDLYGPYVLILTHMTISHDEHIGLVYCAYCNETDLKTHFNDGSMQTCYERYKQKPDVADVIGDNLIPNIVKKFYDSLKNLSMLLGVHTRRYLHSFTGIAYGWLDPIFGSNARYEVVFRQRKVRKTISKEKLNTFAKNVWMQFYGRPIPISIWVQNDDATAERSTRSNRSNVNSQNENEFNQDEQQQSTSSRAYTSHNESRSTTSPMSEISAQTSDTNKTSEEKFGDYVASRLELQKKEANRRRLEAAIQTAILSFETKQLENE